jgi:hypothetical protein
MFETTNQKRIFMTHERDFRLIHQKNLIETVKFGNGFLRYTDIPEFSCYQGLWVFLHNNYVRTIPQFSDFLQVPPDGYWCSYD